MEFEKLVGTKAIVEKYQKLIYEEVMPPSDSSDEPFQFNISDEKARRIKKKQKHLKKMIAARQKLTSRERI